MASKSKVDLTAAEKDALIEEIRERFTYCTDFWAEIRREAKTDMRYVAGDPWDPKDRKLREDAGRPCLSLDELGQYFNQVINDVRANPRAMKFDPTGNGANDETARFYADKAREIEYRSKAQQAYLAAFENALQRSYGYCRVKTKWAHERAFVQDLWIEPIPNPDMVYIDPEAQRPDGSDMTYAFVYESWKIAEFKRQFPKAEVLNFGDYLADAPLWVTDQNVVVAEYWKIKTRERRLLQFQLPDGRTHEAFEDEIQTMPEQIPVINERMVDYPSVCQYLTNGVEILSVTEWPGKYIPIAACYGKRLFVDDGTGAKLKILSMTRLARDPFMAYCFYRTCEIENVGMTTKNPYWAYEGQLTAAQVQAIQQSLHEPVAVLTAKATTAATGAQILPLPVRNVSEPAIQALSVGAEEMRRAIQSAMGSNFLPTAAQRRSEKSGKALEKIEETAQRGSFHFVDHYTDMITHVGVILEDLMDKVYDTARDVGVRKANESAEIVRINDTQAKDPSSGQPKPITTKGDHLVTISTGPQHDSERLAQSDFADTLLSSEVVLQVLGPEKAAKLLAIAIKLKNVGALGDEAAELLDPALGKQGQPDPQQLQAQMAELGQKFQQLQQAAAQMQQALETEQAKQQAQVEKAKIDADKELRIARERNATAIAVAHIAASAKGVQLDAHAAEEAQALGQASLEAERDRAHDVGMAAMSHAQALESGEQGQAHAMEQQAMTPPEASA